MCYPKEGLDGHETGQYSHSHAPVGTEVDGGLVLPVECLGCAGERVAG